MLTQETSGDKPEVGHRVASGGDKPTVSFPGFAVSYVRFIMSETVVFLYI